LQNVVNAALLVKLELYRKAISVVFGLNSHKCGVKFNAEINHHIEIAKRPQSAVSLINTTH
jgi:hypothetical protein